MPFTDYDAATLACGIYSYAGDDAISWDFIDTGEDTGVYWAIKRADGVDNLVFRGSTVPLDFLRDAEAIAEPVEFPEIGPVHYGFAKGLDRVADRFLSRKPGPVRIIGHSLGAGRTPIFTGYMVCEGHPVVERIAFGEPRAGMQQLADLIKGAPQRSYRNSDAFMVDYVTTVPARLSIYPYVHPAPLIDVTEEPRELLDPWGPFRLHHMQLYRAAMHRMFPPRPLALAA